MGGCSFLLNLLERRRPAMALAGRTVGGAVAEACGVSKGAAREATRAGDGGRGVDMCGRVSGMSSSVYGVGRGVVVGRCVRGTSVGVGVAGGAIASGVVGGCAPGESMGVVGMGTGEVNGALPGMGW